MNYSALEANRGQLLELAGLKLPNSTVGQPLSVDNPELSVSEPRYDADYMQHYLILTLGALACSVFAR